MLTLELLENRCLLSVVITDSIAPVDDSTVAFPDTGLGQVSAPAYISVANDGAADFNITSNPLVLASSGQSNPNFSLTYPTKIQLPASYNATQAQNLTQNLTHSDRLTTDTSQATPVGDVDWYYIDLNAGETANIYSDNLDSSTLAVYNQYGDQLTPVFTTNTSTGLGQIATLQAFYGGRYYIQAGNTLVTDNTRYKLLVKPDTSASPATLDYTTNTSALGNILANRTDTQDFWYKFDATYGDQIEVSFQIIDPQQTDGAQIEVYNNLGQVITSSAWTQQQDLDATLYDSSTYYIHITNNVPQDHVSQFQVSLSKTGTIYEVPAGGSSTIAVWATPCQLGALTDSLSIRTDNAGGTEDIISLTDTAVPGDISFHSISFPDSTYPDFVQTNKPLDISLSMQNSAAGDISDSIPVKLYLSTDNLFDANDTLLTTSTGQSSLTLTSTEASDGIVLPAGTGSTYPDMELNGTVNIPAVDSGNYYIIAVADPDQQITESSDTNNTIVSGELTLDPYSTLAIDSVGTTQTEIFDRNLDFGQWAIGRVYPQQHVTMFNRGNTPVSITSWSLAAGSASSFSLLTDDSSGPMVLQPGQQRSIYIQFNPLAFNDQGQATLTDTLTVNTSETGTNPYLFNLTGTVTGPDLLVFENSGTANDNKLEMGTIRTGQTSTPQAFHIYNNGDHNLFINSIATASSNSPFSMDLSSLSFPLTLTPGSTIDVQATFSSSQTGTFSDKILIKSSDRNDDYVYTLTTSATAVSSMIAVHETSGIADDNTIDYGLRAVDSNSDYTETIVISNPGSASLTISGWSFADNTNNPFSTSIINDPSLSTDDITVAAGGSTNLNIIFRALSAGSFDNTLNIYSDGGNASVQLLAQAEIPTINITSSTGTTGATSLPMGTLKLDHNTSSDSNDWFLITPGNVPLDLGTISLQGTGFSISADNNTALPGQTLTLNQTLDPGDSLRVNVSFNTTALSPDLFATNSNVVFQGTVSITSDTAQDINLPLTATVVTPEIDTSATSITFNTTDIGSKDVQQIEISNISNSADLTLTDIQIVNASGVQTQATRQFQIDTANNLVIPAGQHQDINITYHPTQSGPVDAYLSLPNNDLDEYNTLIPLHAAAQSRPILIAPNTNYTFTDESGDIVKVNISQGGGRLYLNNGLPDHADINRLVLIDTTEQTKVNISTRGNGTTSLGTLTANNSLAIINAPKVTINKTINIDGSLASMKIDNIADNANIQIAKSTGLGLNVNASRIGSSVNFSVTGTINDFRAQSYNSGSLSATNINRINITGAKHIPGIMAADIQTSQGDIDQILATGNISGNITSASDIGKIISKKGDVSARIVAYDNIKSVIAKHGTFDGVIRGQMVNSVSAYSMENAIISTPFYMGTVKIKTNVTNSHLLVGYDIGIDGIADATDPGLIAGKLKSFRFGGTFSNSYVAVAAMDSAVYHSLGIDNSAPAQSKNMAFPMTIKGGHINGDNNGNQFGFYFDAHSLFKTNIFDTTTTDDFVIMPIA